MVSNALRTIECGWGIQLNGDATFGLCRTSIDMIALGFTSNSMGAVNNPWCISYIPHKTEKDLCYTTTFYHAQTATIELLNAELCDDEDCEFCSGLCMLKSRLNIDYKDGNIPVLKAQCDQLPGWAWFTREVFSKDPNTCALTGKFIFYSEHRSTLNLMYAGIAAAGYHHIRYFARVSTMTSSTTEFFNLSISGFCLLHKSVRDC